MLSMLTVPKREGRYNGERVPLSVKTVAGWLNVKEDCVRCIARHRPDYPLTPEKAELLSFQTAISEGWLLAGNPKAKPVNWYHKPYSQADFDARQIELAKRPRQARQQLVSAAFVRNAALLAEILLCASEQKKFDAYAASVKTTLGKLYYSLTSKPTSLVGKAVLSARAKGTPARPNLDALLDGFEARLKKIA